MSKEIDTCRSQPVAFELLGSVEAFAAGKRLSLGTDRDRRLLTGLLAARGQPVERDRLMGWVWDDPLPDGATDEFYRLMHGLRRRLDESGLRNVLISKDRLCCLEVPADCVDVHRFHDLMTRARSLGDHDPQAAERLLGEALQQFRGEPLAGLRGQRVDGYRVMLIEERHAAELYFNAIALNNGRYFERISALAGMLQDRPHDQSVASLYMRALHLAGRQQDALDVYQQIYRHVVDELGGTISRNLMDTHRSILSGDDLGRQDTIRTSPEPPPDATIPEPPAAGRREPSPAADSNMVTFNAAVYVDGSGIVIGRDQVNYSWPRREHG